MNLCSAEFYIVSSAASNPSFTLREPVSVGVSLLTGKINRSCMFTTTDAHGILAVGWSSLPPKPFDQLGPVRFHRLSKLCRTRKGSVQSLVYSECTPSFDVPG